MLGGLDSVFEKLEEYRGIMAYMNFQIISNGVAGSQRYFDYMRVYRDAQETILDYRGQKIEWMEIGNPLMTEIFDNYESFQDRIYFLYGQDSIYTLYFQNIAKVMFEEPAEHFKDYIRKNQPLQELMHNVYERANEMEDDELTGSQNILNTYLNYSLDKLAYREKITLRDLLENDYSSLESSAQTVPRSESLLPPKQLQTEALRASGLHL